MSGLFQTYDDISYAVEKQSDGGTKITVEVANERFERVKGEVLKRLAPTVAIKGFRQGKAPDNLIAAHLGPRLFEETLGQLIPACTAEIIQREKLAPIDQVKYNVESIAQGSGVKYTATFTTFPQIKLPSLKKVKAERKAIQVKDAEVDKVIQQMFEAGSKKDGKSKSAPDKEEMNDEWAASLNLGVKTLDELKVKVKGELKRQMEAVEHERYVTEILDQLAQASKVVVPQTLSEEALERKEQEYIKRIEQLGMKVDDFLRNQKTSLEELRKDWKAEIEEGLRRELVLMQFAQDAQVKVDEKEVDEYIETLQDEQIKQQYKTTAGKRSLQRVLYHQKVVEQLVNEVQGKGAKKAKKK